MGNSYSQTIISQIAADYEKNFTLEFNFNEENEYDNDEENIEEEIKNIDNTNKEKEIIDNTNKEKENIEEIVNHISEENIEKIVEEEIKNIEDFVDNTTQEIVEEENKIIKDNQEYTCVEEDNDNNTIFLIMRDKNILGYFKNRNELQKNINEMKNKLTREYISFINKKYYIYESNNNLSSNEILRLVVSFVDTHDLIQYDKVQTILSFYEVDKIYF